MKTYIVQLEKHDDVITAREKISWSKARRVLLVWPRFARILERRVDLLLLARYCQQIGAQIAVVTNSPEVKYHARALGIPIFKKAEKAQKTAWRRPGALNKEWRAGRPVLSQSLREHRMLREQRTLLTQAGALEADFLAKPRLRLAVFSVAVLAVILLALSFAPGARVRLSPVQDTQEITLAGWASPDIRSPNPSGGLPAYSLAVVVEGRALADSSGRTLIPEQYATGQVQLTNLSDESMVIPQGSIVFTTSAPAVRFLTNRQARLAPGPGTKVTVPVQAALPGRAGNVRANQVEAMEGPLGQRLVVANPEPMTGGSDRSSPAPSLEDYRRLRDQLMLDLHETAREELTGQLAPGQRLLAQSLSVRSVSAEDREPAVDYPSEQLQLTMRVEFQGWYVEEADLESLANTILDASLPDGFQIVPGSFQVEFREEARQSGSLQDSDPLPVHWKAVLSRMVEAGWAEAQMVEAIRGRRVEDAKKILAENLALAEPPQIELTPGWWGRLPFLPIRIELEKQ